MCLDLQKILEETNMNDVILSYFDRITNACNEYFSWIFYLMLIIPSMLYAKISKKYK